MKFNIVNEDKKTFKDVGVGQIFLADRIHWLKINETEVNPRTYEYAIINAVSIDDGTFYVEYFSNTEDIERIYTNITINLA